MLINISSKKKHSGIYTYKFYTYRIYVHIIE